MASTTKTTNLELSQFVGTDKPAWLTDYNGDMQKIDNGYKKLEDANKATQADLDLTKTSLEATKTDVTNMEAEIQALEAGDNTMANRVTVLEANYDTMHHEVAVNEDNIATNEASIKTNATNIATINNKLNAKTAIGGIKYDMGVTDKIKSIEIRPTGTNKEDLSLVVTTAAGSTKYIDLYDYNSNLVLPSFYSSLQAISRQLNITVPAGQAVDFEIEVGSEVITVSQAICQKDVVAANYYVSGAGTSNAKVHLKFRNNSQTNYTGIGYYITLDGVKGVSL